MMNSKHPGTKMIYQFSLDDYIPKDHFLRLVEDLVDFRFVRDLVRSFYSDRGAPSVDPVVIFKMSLLGYFYGISSERRLAEECRYNLAFKWFLHYDIDEMPPDHSIFSKARARYGRQSFEQFFAEIVRKCADAGLIDGERIFVDATLLKANASRKSLVTRDNSIELRQTPREYVESLWRENSTQSPDSDNVNPPRPPRRGRRKTNDVMVSETDPDAALVYRPGVGSMLAHKVHIAVADGKDRIVTAVATTPGAVQEHTQVPELLTKHWMVTGEKPREVALAHTSYWARAASFLICHTDTPEIREGTRNKELVFGTMQTEMSTFVRRERLSTGCRHHEHRVMSSTWSAGALVTAVLDTGYNVGLSDRL